MSTTIEVPQGMMVYGGATIAYRGYEPIIIGETWVIPGSQTLIAVERVDLHRCEAINGRLLRRKSGKFNFQPTQRTMAPNHVTTLHRAMETGLFQYATGQPFYTFDINGFLVDGGHRANAQYRYLRDHADETVDVMVASNISLAQAATLDRGRMRSQRQILKYLEVNPGQKDVLAAVDGMMTLRTKGCDKVLPEEIKMVYTEHAEKIEKALGYLHKRKNTMANPISNYGIPRSAVGGFLRGYIEAGENGKAEEILQLFDALKTESPVQLGFHPERAQRFIAYQQERISGDDSNSKRLYLTAEALVYYWLTGEDVDPAGELFPLAGIDKPLSDV